MKTSLTHLPQKKRTELNLIAETIRQITSPEMIILYGSYARGDYKVQADLAPDRRSGHISDYDILVVTPDKKTAEKTALWNTITKKCAKLDLSTHVRIIAPAAH